ncbi:hypothetical protein L596_001246 [Steinernema carpocapsae]|uniref:Uncharacterized protein n=1 Tax=Steinernema carpocapsae TaxID=34508 RepID=A0A4U8UKP9_STECR|nr:hypothetical protein L596_001246 [Steinernema carpocapsae]
MWLKNLKISAALRWDTLGGSHMERKVVDTSSFYLQTYGFVVRNLRMLHGYTTLQLALMICKYFPQFCADLTEISLLELESGMLEPKAAYKLIAVIHLFFQTYFSIHMDIVVAHFEYILAQKLKSTTAELTPFITVMAPITDLSLPSNSPVTAEERLQAKDWFPGVPTADLISGKVSLGSRPGTSGIRLFEEHKKRKEERQKKKWRWERSIPLVRKARRAIWQKKYHRKTR